MSLKLLLVCWHAPRGVLLEMLDRVASRTTGALDRLLEEHAPSALASLRAGEPSPSGSLETRRAAMASAHSSRVRALVSAVGREEAVRLGREALFPVGVALGREARERLGVGESFRDVERAARLLYRVLGIHFRVEKCGDGAWTMRVDRCALAQRYSAETCEILSAADEGVVSGLSPKHAMRFEKRMTGGSAECLARITEVGK